MTADDHTTLIDAQELAGRLGKPVRTIYDLAARGDLPHYRIGRGIRFDLAEVLQTTRQTAPVRPGTSRRAAGSRLADRMSAIERGRSRAGTRLAA